MTERRLGVWQRNTGKMGELKCQKNEQSKTWQIQIVYSHTVHRENQWGKVGPFSCTSAVFTSWILFCAIFICLWWPTSQIDSIISVGLERKMAAEWWAKIRFELLLTQANGDKKQFVGKRQGLRVAGHVELWNSGAIVLTAKCALHRFINVLIFSRIQIN